MGYTSVEHLVDQTPTNSQPEILEDEEGFRVLEIYGDEIPVHVWQQAYDQHVMLIVQQQSGHAISTEQFLAEREEIPTRMCYRVTRWRTDLDQPSLREYYADQTPQAKAETADDLGTFVHLHTHYEYCLTPETRVCTADLVWKPIGEVVEGEQLVGFGEDLRPPEGQRGNSRSKMERTTVTAVKRVMRDCYKIRLVDGTEIVASAEHGWVVNHTARGSQVEPGGEPYRRGGNSHRWVKTKDLLVSESPLWANRQVAKPSLVLWAKPWEPEVPQDLQREAAWLAGVADGEGWLGSGILHLGQNPGPVMDEMQRVCKALGYETTKVRVQSSKRSCEAFRLQGYETTLRFMAQCRPVRFAGRTDEIWAGKRVGSRYTKPIQIESVEHVGQRETVALATTTKTFVAEGFLSHNSALDGLSTVDEVAAIITEQGQKALGSCDHGNCAVHPELQAKADQYGFRPVFGMEAYFVPDRHRRTRRWIELDGVEVEEASLSKKERDKAEKKSDSEEVRNEYTHLSLWAQDQDGLHNLWAMSTEAYRDGLFDGKPRLDWDTLDRLSAGVICGTGCLRGPVARKILAGDLDGARDVLMRLAYHFPERLYVEIHCNGLDDQKIANEGLIALAREYSLPLVAAVDSHYPAPEQQVIHDIWVRMQTGKTLVEDTSMFEGNQPYHLLSENAIREGFRSQGLDEADIDEAMANTVEIARQCTAEVRGEATTPTYSKASKDHPDPIQRDVERVFEICQENWERRTRGKTYPVQEAMDRFEREMRLLVDKQFCGYFLIVWDYVTWAKGQGCLVGPSRGSGGGSFVAYLMGITEIDPIQHDLIFERFLTEGRTSLPDFDIDFPTSWRGRVTNYIRNRWGEEYTSSIGTVLRLRSKAAINDVYRALEPILPYEIPFKEREALKKLIDAADASLAGKHLPWEEFCEQFDDLVGPMRKTYPEVFEAVDGVVDRLKSYGKHAAGVVISTDRPLTQYPMRLTEVTETVNGKKVKTQMMVTQFDMNALEILGLVKFDILTLRTLDTLQESVDLIHERTSHRINPYDWVEEYEDPEVWDQVADGRTLGLFQVETASGTRMIRRMKPANLEDLAAVVTVVRPGPMRSGLTESFLRRRAGIEPVTYPDPRMESFVGNTYGAMIYQEQVMAACMTLAGYDSNEADSVRKILGKKQVEKVQAAGAEFIRRAPEHDTDPDIANLLWNQMAEFAKYGFNRAHAFAYAVLGHWTAWLKFHFPAEFLVACMSTVDSDRVPEFIDECRVMGYTIKPPCVNRSKVPFTAEGLDVVYGLSMVSGIGEPTAREIVRNQPYTSLDDFLTRVVEPQGSPVNMGHVKTLVAVGAFDSIVENRRAVEIQLERESSGEARKCIYKIEAPNPAHPFQVPCSYDWPNEPDPPMLRKRNKETKKMESVPKDPPKRCTTACRQYSKPEPIAASEVSPYSPRQIMERERELLGVWVSATPWDHVAQDYLDRSHTASDIERGPAEAQYVGVCIVESVKKRKDKNGNDYAFVALNMQDGKVEPVCFASVWVDHAHNIVKDAVGVVLLWKTARGLQLQDFAYIPPSD